MDLPETQRLWKGVTWRAVVVALIVAGLVILGIVAAINGTSGAETTSSGGGDDYVSLLEPVGTTGISRVTLSEIAAKRLGIETVPVKAAAAGEQQSVPYSAVVYDPAGVAWTYTNPEPLTYVRQRLTVDRIAGENAILTSGPPTGTPVVSVGAMELFGAEIDFGKG